MQPGSLHQRYHLACGGACHRLDNLRDMGDALCGKFARSRLSPLLRINKENLAHFLGNKSEQALEFTPVRKIILVIFALTFAVMIYGVAVLGWWMAEISTGISGQRNYHRSDRPHERGTDLYLYQRRARFAGRCTDYRYRARYRSDHG